MKPVPTPSTTMSTQEKPAVCIVLSLCLEVRGNE